MRGLSELKTKIQRAIKRLDIEERGSNDLLARKRARLVFFVAHAVGVPIAVVLFALGHLTVAQMGSLASLVGVLAAIYFGMVSARKDYIDPRINLVFLGISLSMVTIFHPSELPYSSVIRYSGWGAVMVMFLELFLWYYTGVHHLRDVPDIVRRVIPSNRLPKALTLEQLKRLQEQEDKK